MRRESIQLTDKQFANLEGLAKTTKSIAQSGSRKGKPSWRSLIRRIADGDLTVAPK